ncbi:hypothetical protein C8A05DRAFT_14554 [Staphylotrichum tortipilum]|uniref:DNA repair protein Rad26 n=1 Tax=Staphylotrichum tortipilum TaxID=2831512 RepID=A0AAN6RVC8_9PEZI|nr:hypothetical protein C8A05DRAFT_14554 [Staphylotrichum longicolle]
MDDFSDDSFDDLNDTALQELEDKALQFTQAQKLAQSQAQSQAAPNTQRNAVDQNAFDFAFEDDDLDDTVVIDVHAQAPPQQGVPLPLQQARQSAGLAGTQRWNQHLPPPRPSYPSRPQFPPPTRPAAPPLPSQRGPPPIASARSQRPHPPPSQFARPTVPIPHRPYPAQASQARHSGGPPNQTEIIAALRARLADLEWDLTTARGEASVLRSKYEKDRATHEAGLARLKKEQAEQVTKQERIAEQARAAERTTATELQFARQDLREELGRAKSRRKDGGGPATPRKDRTWGMADGFDGLETLSSPTKTQSLRRKDSSTAMLAPSERTPTKGKRKRPIVDSPTFALETDAGDALFDDAHAGHPPSLAHPAGSRPPPSFDFLRLFLDHTTARGQPPTFDVLSRYAFPSDANQSLASIILQNLPLMGNPGEPLGLLVDFADMLIEMWHRCLSEKYHGPIYHLVSLLLYTLELNAVGVAPHIISSLIPVCATTCRLVHNTVDSDLPEQPDAVARQLCLGIDVTQCLLLLHLAALGCLSHPARESGASDPPTPSPQLDFWRTMELDFVLMMLARKHSEADWLTMMSMLHTSAGPDSIGPIPSSATDPPGGRAKVHGGPGAVALTLIDCVSSFLCEPPRWATLGGSVKGMVARSAALETLTTLATSPFGVLQIAESDVAIPRLVTILSWAVDRLYDLDLPRSLGEPKKPAPRPGKGDAMDVDGPDPNATQEMHVDKPQDAPAPAPEEALHAEPDPRSLLCRIISRGTALLHFLVTDPRTSDVANTSTKLAASHGGSQRYFLTLARLNFAEEDLVLESGIDADTVELAHELLELAATPDEGEEIGEMFD